MSKPQTTPRRIYLAGPEVFLPDAEEIGARKKALCARHGFEGLFPLDTELSAQALSGSPQELGFAISAGNEQLIQSCDVLIANLTPFRGPSADAGTVYELGLARGLGKSVFGYSNSASPYLARVWSQFGWVNTQTGQLQQPGPPGEIRDRNGHKIEEFELHDNLMIEGGIRLSGGVFVSAETDSHWSDLTGFEYIIQRLNTQPDKSGLL